MKKLLLSLLILGFLLPYNLFAAELPLTEKLLFNRQLKEFASKILLPEIRHSDPNQANIDIKNLQEIITEKILNSHEHLIELKNFILHNVFFSSAFKEFNKSICDKIKFDSLQFQNKDLNSLNDLEFSYNFNGDKKPQLTLSEKLLFKSSFNSSLHRPLFHTKKPYTFLSSKDLQQEFSLIVADYQKITDVDTLNKYGPSVVERSEKILLGTDDTLALDNVVYLIEMSGNCDIALKYGLSIPQDSKQKYFLEYINKIYNKAVIVNYKYCLWYYATRVYDSAKKYDDLVEYSVNIKKDIFEKLNYDNKFSMTTLIGYCVTYYCEAKEKFYEIGKENCIQTINLVEFTTNPYYPTPEDKRILKLNYRLRLTAEFYAKYKQYNEAISELDIIISSPPPTSGNTSDLYKDIIASANKRKNELLPLTVYIKTDKEKIVCNTSEKLTILKVEVVDGSNQNASYNIMATSDNNEIAEILSVPTLNKKSTNSKIFNIKIKNIGECNINVIATSKSIFLKSTITKKIPLHSYSILLSEASFISNGSPYIKLKEFIETSPGTFVDQEITSPEYKFDGISAPLIKPVALTRNTFPDFSIKLKILFSPPISMIKIRAWARAENEEVPPVGEFIDVKPDISDPSIFIVKCKMTKDFSNNSICSKNLFLNYQISEIIYQNASGTQIDNCSLADITKEKIAFYYSWKAPLKEPVFKQIAYFASNWATNSNDEKNIVDELYKGWTLKKAPEHEYNFSATKIIKNWDDEEDALKQIITEEYGQCRVMSYFFKNLCNFHGINIKIVIFTLAKKKENDYYKKGEYYEFLVHNWGIGKKIKKRGPTYDVYEVLDSNPKWTYPFVYSQTYTNNNTLAYYQKASWNSSGWQCDYWCFTNHVVCILDNQWFYDASFDNLPFNFTYPGNNSTSIYDLKDKNDPIVKYIKMNVSFLGGIFDVLNDSIIKNFDNVYIPISKIINEQCENSNEINFYKLEINWKEL